MGESQGRLMNHHRLQYKNRFSLENATQRIQWLNGTFRGFEDEVIAFKG